jgi:RNA polymerase sigma factor (sigma-70 family)
LSSADTLDFTQTVHLSLLQRDYSIFRQFSGRSSLRTYLLVVVTRLLIDWRNSTHGKWRPSAVAVRLGPEAVALERLMIRDGHPLNEAVEIRTERSGRPAADLRDLARQLPARVPRRMVGEEMLTDVPAPAAADPVEAGEARQASVRVRAALGRALAQLPQQDRELIRMRWVRECSVREIGETLALEPKALYRRFDRMLRTLRDELVASGITRPVVGL